MSNYALKIAINFVFIILLISGCSHQKKLQQKDNFKYSIKKPIEGQLHTAKRLKTLMAEKEYEKAINLFSKAQQLEIREIQKNEEFFYYWCLAWALHDPSYSRYCSRIREGKGTFAFEDGAWKIDEK